MKQHAIFFYIYNQTNFFYIFMKDLYAGEDGNFDSESWYLCSAHVENLWHPR